HFWIAPVEDPAPAAIRAAAACVVAATDVPFSSVGLNFYRDGRDSVAPHNDHLDEIVHGFPIALLSLGATRRMTIRAKASPKRVLHVDLAAGSLLVMSYETQRSPTSTADAQGCGPHGAVVKSLTASVAIEGTGWASRLWTPESRSRTRSWPGRSTS